DDGGASSNLSALQTTTVSITAVNNQPALSSVPASASFTQGLRSEEHTSELQSLTNLVCRLLLEKKKKTESAPTQPSRAPASWPMESWPPSRTAAIGTRFSGTGLARATSSQYIRSMRQITASRAN